jgi:hypothetical protein
VNHSVQLFVACIHPHMKDGASRGRLGQFEAELLCRIRVAQPFAKFPYGYLHAIFDCARHVSMPSNLHRAAWLRP